ncbi:60S acidic ribosomal protein P1-like [Acomys russatus]|uniref:60S acidic ribosomal protein P1-like n=1 Tax=Acomys russatus TaxID=60746 RepID=UPI0021E26EFB|nr:60S acidic ribosomal protein P1-like [Acomys russatus]
MVLNNQLNLEQSCKRLSPGEISDPAQPFSQAACALQLPSRLPEKEAAVSCSEKPAFSFDIFSQEILRIPRILNLNLAFQGVEPAVHNIDSISELTCIYSALILQDDQVTAMEAKINVLIKAASVNVEPFWPSLFGKALANVNIGSLICNVGAAGPAPAAGAAPLGGPAPATAAAPAEEKKVEAKKEESEESDDDMGFGLFD